MGSPLRALLRIAGFLAVTAVLLPVQIAAVALGGPISKTLPVRYAAICRRIFGIGIRIKGEMLTDGPVLFVCNHVSYIDIAVLGSIMPGSFVARADLAHWPLFGILAKLRRTVFIDRLSRRAALHRDEISTRLAAGDHIIFFPEGTSDDGNGVLPFKSALFAVASQEVCGGPLTIQPVSIAYTSLDGIPIGRDLRPRFAWYGDMKLLPHAWQALGLGYLTVMVEFHPPLAGNSFSSRKALAAHCHGVVAAGVDAANAGRDTGGFRAVARS